MLTVTQLLPPPPPQMDEVQKLKQEKLKMYVHVPSCTHKL